MWRAGVWGAVRVVCVLCVVFFFCCFFCIFSDCVIFLFFSPPTLLFQPLPRVAEPWPDLRQWQLWEGQGRGGQLAQQLLLRDKRRLSWRR